MFTTPKKTPSIKKTISTLSILLAMTACGGSEPGSKPPQSLKKEELAQKNNTNDKYVLLSQENSNQLMAYTIQDDGHKNTSFIPLNIYTKANAADLIALSTHITVALSDRELSFIGFKEENKPTLLETKLQNVTATRKNQVDSTTTFLSVLINGSTQFYIPTADTKTKQKNIAEHVLKISQPKNQVLPAAILETENEKANSVAFFTANEIQIYKDDKAVKTFVCKNPEGIVTSKQKFAVKCDGAYKTYTFVNGPTSKYHKFTPVNIKNASIKKFFNNGYGNLVGMSNNNIYNYSESFTQDSGLSYSKVSLDGIQSANLCDLVIGSGISQNHRIAIDSSAHAYVIEAFSDNSAGRFKLPKMKNCNAMHATGAENSFYIVDNDTRNLYHLDAHVGLSYHVHNYMPYTNDMNSIHDMTYLRLAK